MRHISMTHLISVLAASATATLAIGCGSSATTGTASAWSCDNVLVPNGSTVECTADSVSALTADTTTYECPINGDINPLCPPTGSTDAGTYTGNDYDAGTTTSPPVGTGSGGSDGSGGGDAGGTGTGSGGSGGPGSDWGCDAGTPVGSGDGTGGGTVDAGKPGNGNPNPGGGNPHGGPPGQGSGGSSGGGYDGGSTGVDGGYTGGETGGGGGPWTCDTSTGKPVCHTPPKCDAGSHPSKCGACVPDGSSEDCSSPSTGGCWITGGGFIVDGDGHDSFGGNAMPMKSGSIRGQWEHVDHGTGNKLHGEPSYIVCRHVAEPGPGANTGPKHDFTMNQAYFGGNARAFVNGTWHDGYWFDVMVEDHGEGKGAKAGGPDYYHLTLRKIDAANASGVIVYDTEANMSGGNIQLHPPNNGHPFTSSQLPSWVSLQP